jgi:outer membrane protein assembly factor BamA
LRGYSKLFRWHLLQRLAFVPLVLVLLLVASSPCPARQALTLRRIEFVGLKRLSPQQVIEASGLKVGDKVNQERIDAAAATLVQSGLFRRLGYKLRTTGTDATVIFEVEESAKGLPVVFENFVWFSEDEILAAIKTDHPFYDGTSPAAGPTADKIAAALQKLLNRKNIPGQVDFLPNFTKDRQELVFSVKGTRIPVCALHFPGASKISESELIRAAQPVLRTDYSKKDIEAFTAKTLVPLYRRLGHLRAQFDELTVTTTNSTQCAGGVEVTIPVREGSRYQWAGSVWDGNEKLTVTDLATALGMNPGELADGSRIDSGLKKVRAAYANRGYLATQVKESMEFDDAASRVKYLFNIIEGPRYFMGNLIVNGLAAADAEQFKAKWTLGTNAVFDDSYLDTFRQTSLREFIMKLSQKSPNGARVKVDAETRPNAQTKTVDVVFNFK